MSVFESSASSTSLFSAKVSLDPAMMWSPRSARMLPTPMGKKQVSTHDASPSTQRCCCDSPTARATPPSWTLRLFAPLVHLCALTRRTSRPHRLLHFTTTSSAHQQSGCLAFLPELRPHPHQCRLRHEACTPSSTRVAPSTSSTWFGSCTVSCYSTWAYPRTSCSRRPVEGESGSLLGYEERG